MLEILRRSQRWIMWFVIVGVGFVFTVYLGSGNPSGTGRTSAVVEVDGRRYGPRDLDRVRRFQEEQYRAALGDDYDASAASDQLDEIAANVLVTQAILAREAERMGLAVSDEEVRDYVRLIPGATDEEGRLQGEDLRYWAEAEYGNEAKFVEVIRTDLLAQKLRRLLLESLEVTEQEARESLTYRQEEVTIAYVALDTTSPPPDVVIAEAEIEELLASDEEGVRKRYDARREVYDLPERVRARHILLRIPPGAEEAERTRIRKQAEETLARVRGGADFAEVAREVSEDPGSKEDGGDLGFFGRGQMVKPFEDVAFALEPGAMSDLVESSFGLHIIRVEEKKPAETIPFEDARRELAEEMLRERKADVLARETADRLAAAIGEGKTLVDAARAEGVTLERPDPLRRRPDGYIPALGAAPDVLTAAFTLSEEEPTLAEIFEVGDRLVLIELLERSAPGEEEIAAEMDAERERLRALQQQELPQAWLNERRTALSEAGKLSFDLSQLR
jgi:peptidyl-prolyl cis-trans isomerase D